MVSYFIFPDFDVILHVTHQKFPFVSVQSVCNAFWLLNRYFTSSEITWMLNEGIFLLRMLVYPFDNESYLWYYFLFGWGMYVFVHLTFASVYRVIIHQRRLFVLCVGCLMLLVPIQQITILIWCFLFNRFLWCSDILCMPSLHAV